MRRATAFLGLGGLLLGAFALVDCDDGGEVVETPTGTTTGTGGSGTGGGAGGGIGGFNVGNSGGSAGEVNGGGGQGGGPGPACGDAAIDPGEQCDDANTASGDGCSGNCQVESGYACPVPGQACVYTVVCGDHVINGAETCDDGNATPLDGCDASCHVELGWQCLSPGVACVAAACGDSIVAGQEQCDDGNGGGGDGCSATCQLEAGFKCPTPGQPCVPTVCGDGIAEGTEQCDDGDHDMGDGCSPFCVKEPDCTLGACTSACGDGIKLPNGPEACDDGNTKNGDGCSATCELEPGYACVDALFDPDPLLLPIVLRDFQIAHPDFEGPCCGVDGGITTGLLGADGKPVYANPGGTTPMTTGQANFDEWYRDVGGVNQTILQTLSLAKQGNGSYLYSNGNFFPLDGQGFGNEGNAHNFHFTSEVRYWFAYQGGESLQFTGDDDVWVYVNKQKAVDLGGVHGALPGGVVLDAAAAATYGLAVGSIYEIVVWQAERHTTQSSYTLTLGQFTHYKTGCQSVCGNGVKTPDEACDDGVNDGSYGGCNPDCTLAPYCGDATVQVPFGEECDDGANLSPYGGCAPGCVLGHFCGDGIVDGLFGEACDDGINVGGYGECEPDCSLGPRCGDGVVQTTFGEQCDDGNTTSNDGCDAVCHAEVPQ
ncbi:MAG: DUF4215 domain-containing protein [Polyangiaceae bacterium]|nr:DUF4215 domain-containing protein [Polyangiaceae bacterium]